MTVLGMVGEMERKFIRERQHAGIEAIKADKKLHREKYAGRKATIDPERIREMHKAGMGPSAVAQTLGISRMSVHRVLNPKPTTGATA